MEENKENSTGDDESLAKKAPEENKLPDSHSTQDESILLSQPSEIESKAEPVITKTTTEEMEVHHHTHAGHHKKTWKEYLFEFFMLFLAVFCGFLAEYQLEHVIEHQREKEFINSMIDDLQEDREKTKHYIEDLQLGVKRLDTLISILNSDSLIKTNTSQLYYLARLSPRTILFTNNTRTFDQLKNSGSFRLIRNTSAASKIMSYYNDINYIRQLEDLYLKEFEEYKRIASKIFDPAIFRSMERENGEISRDANNPFLRTNDTELLSSLGIYAVYMNGSRRSILPAAVELQKKGNELAAYLKKEYHLE